MPSACAAAMHGWSAYVGEDPRAPTGADSAARRVPAPSPFRGIAGYDGRASAEAAVIPRVVEAIDCRQMSDSSNDASVDALRISDARWRAVIDAAVDGIIVIDSRGRIEAFNHAAEQMFAYREDEVLGQNIRMLMPEPDRSKHDGYLRHHLDTGERRIIGIGRAVTGLRRDGQQFPLHLSVGEFTIDGEQHFTGILHDLSRRTELEDRLREATALARLGEMAAVIAHEVKNPLAAVRGAVQVIGSRLPTGNNDAAIVKEIIARIDGLNDLIQDLLVFARPPAPKPVQADLRALSESVVQLLKRDPAFAELEVVIEGDRAAAPRRCDDADDRDSEPADQFGAGDAGSWLGQGLARRRGGLALDRDCRHRPRHPG